ncbi:TetR/AcrR family transcriptional regulator [Couchioplanes caeruleus]|uniref:TetR family transcriptional regulator n=2 Tax=Couchioplanes caeruleus TaxID=56438 RepID=A0A1K0FJD5_9ACTN|nr:TetR/AcrR family transcriptional regulator [Couchioplanes caeruleus]OJF12975.1 TetR family transcriptional regulator [Couchioplanes caeruleus subsp. caeruleus]ROP32002.1 TetR family transcriptional regulator [Couchioplanes caeruleus]
MPAASPQPPQRIDGRTARAERTRAAIVEAHLMLLREGELRPTADRIAKRAGVSLRALWSHFADMEALFAASGQLTLDQRDDIHEPIPRDLPLERRIELWCHQRARQLEQIAPVARASSLKEPFSPALQSYRRIHIQRVRDELKSLFAGEIGGDEDTLNALTAAAMWPTWGTLRDAMGLDPAAARTALARIVRSQLSR